MHSSQPEDAEKVTHVVYDKATGRIVGTLRHHDMVSGKDTAYDTDKVLELFSGDQAVLSKITDGDVSNLAVMTTSLPATSNVRTLRFSDKRQALVMRPRLRLRADREVLEGDGKDAVTLSIDVIDEEGRVLRDYQGEVLVTTTRGKLSTKGGRVKVEAGQGSVILTSVRETVDRVQVKARMPDGSAASDEMMLSFE
ncbi:MAG TPA: hypothetical protein VF658_04890 [Pyrinomonadaceae bacterium]|jgi:hypothetical protein